MSIDIKGTITHIGETKSFGEKGFQKRSFVVKTDEKYPQELEIEATKDRIQSLDGLGIGDQVSASVNIKGRRWDGPNGTKYFVSLEAWKIEATSKGSRSSAPQSGGAQTDDLPF